MINGDPWLKMFDFLCDELVQRAYQVMEYSKIADDDSWW